MADTTFQIGVQFDNSAATAGLAQLNSSFQSTTSAVASMWTQASSTITVALKNVSTEAENTAGRTKEQIEKASSSVEKLGDLIGVKVPGGLTKMLAASETIGPALEAAFAPLEIIAFIQFAVELADKIKTVSENLAGWTQEVRDNYEALVQENRQIVDFNEKLTDSARRLNEIGHTGADLIKIQIQNEKAHREEIRAKTAALGMEEAALRHVLEETHKVTRYQPKIGQVEVDVPNSQGLSDEEIEKKKKRLGELAGDKDHIKGEIEQLREEMKTLDTVVLPGKEAELAHTQVQESISAAEARLAGERKVTLERIDLEQSVTRNQLLQGKITAEQAGIQENKALDERYNAQVRYLTRLQGVLSADPEHNKDRLLEIKSQLKAVEVEHQKAVLDLYNQTLEKKKELEKSFTAAMEEQHRKQQEDAAKEVEKAFQKAHQKVEEMKRIQDIYEESSRQHDEAIGAMERSRLDFELQMGRISQKEHDKLLKAELQAEAAAAVEKLRIKQAIWGRESEEYARLEAQITKIHDKTAQAIQKADQDTAKNEQKRWQDLAKSISSSIGGALNSWIQGSQTLSQAWAKMADDMAMKFIESLERQLIQFLVHLAVKDAADKAASAKNNLRSAYDSAHNTYKWATGVVGPVIAGVLAAGAFVAAESLGSAEGGQYLVPNNQLTMLHRNEMVLPSGVADRMRGVIEGGGGGGISVVVNHSVNAVDADSFRTHIRRNASMIGNEVARVLKRKAVS
jgi:hypothetical protein